VDLRISIVGKDGEVSRTQRPPPPPPAGPAPPGLNTQG